MVAEVEPGPREAAPLPKPELRALVGASPTKVKIEDAGFFYGKFRALRDVNLDVPEQRVHGAHRTVWLWQVDAPPDAQPDVRPGARQPSRGRRADRR